MTQHDFTIADGPGQPIRLDLQAAVQALASCSSGAEPATKYPGMFWLDLSVLPDGLLKMRDQANAAWLAVPAGFPTKATSAETIAGTDDTKYVTPKYIADRDVATGKQMRNRLVNGAMQISQELGDTGTGTTGSFIADQWVYHYVGPVSVGGFRASTIAPTANGPSTNKLRIALNVQNAKPVLAAGDYMIFMQAVEGLRVADFGWGAATAKRAILRFVARAAVAGNYSVAIRNSALNRSWLGSFNIPAAGVDKLVVMVIPGDVTGTWLTDTGVGLFVSFVFACGTTYIGVPGWQAGNFSGLSGMANGASIVNSGNHITDVGLYLDVDGTGVPPLWEQPDQASELLACQRYYVTDLWSHTHLATVAAGVYYANVYAPVEMRATPTFTAVNWSNANFPVSGTIIAYDRRCFREGRTASASGSSFFGSNITAVARL